MAEDTKKSPMRQLARLVHVDQWTPGIVQTWTPTKVKTALREHQDGQFVQTAQLVNAMLEDDEIPGAVDTAVNFMAAAEVQFSQDDEPSELAKSLGEVWARSVPISQLAKILFWFVWMGVGVGVLDWTRKDGKWSSVLRTLNPEFLYWDDGQENPQTGRRGVWMYEHRDGSEMVQPGDGRWVLLSDGRESWRHCSVRALALTWLIKQYTLRDWARYNERHGLPIVKAKIPAFSAPPDKTQFMEDVKTLGTDTTVNLPSHMMPESGHEIGYDLELLEATDQAWETFKQTIDRCDRKIKMHFLGSNTFELEGTAGSRATQDSGRSIAMQKAQERMRRVVEDIRDQIVKPIVELSFGQKVSDDDLPTPKFLIEGDEDLEKRARTMDRFASALVKMKNAGQDITNLSQEAAQYGLELEEREPEPMPAIGPNNPNGPPNGQPPQNGQQQTEEAHEHTHDAETLDILEMIGKRDGFEAAQDYLDRVVDHSTAAAGALEKVSAERMAAIIEGSDSPEDIYQALESEVKDAAPVELATLFEKAMILAEMSGRFAVEEDL